MFVLKSFFFAISPTSSPCLPPSSTCSPLPSSVCSSLPLLAWRQPSCWRQASWMATPWPFSSAKLLRFCEGLEDPSCPSWACKLPPLPPHHRQILPHCLMQQPLSSQLSSLGRAQPWHAAPSGFWAQQSPCPRALAGLGSRGGTGGRSQKSLCLISV